MVFIFHHYFTVGKTRDVTGKANASHKIREPFPHGITIKFAQQSGMMKTYPASLALGYVTLKSLNGRIFLAIGRIMQLNEEIVL